MIEVRENKEEVKMAKGLAGGKLNELFVAYFNNKMWMLLMLIEHPEISRSALSIEHLRSFLHDLYHHFLPQESELKYRHAFEWLFRFLKLYPKVDANKIYRAIEKVALVYEAFGLELPKRLEAERLEREGMGGKIKCQEKE